jgi:hypothetical protein
MPSTEGKFGVINRLINIPGGYDFYKRLKAAAQRVASGEVSPDTVFDQLKAIKKDAERNHNLLMARRFWNWWKELEGAVVASPLPKGVYRREGMNFGIKLAPELIYEQGGQKLITYLWATKFPRLTRQVAAMGLAVLKSELQSHVPGAKFQILDLRQERVVGEEEISNQTPNLLQADIALLNSLWESASLPKAA